MSGDQRPPGKLRLGDKWLAFVGEGSANTIWALHFAQDTGGDEYTENLRKSCNGYLLRIQKHQAGHEPSDSSYTARDQITYLRNEVLPLFERDPASCSSSSPRSSTSSSIVVYHGVVNLTQPIIDEANAVLAELDDKYRALRGPPGEKGKKPNGGGKEKNGTRDDPHPHLPLRSRKFVGSRVGPQGWHMLTEDFRPRRPNERFAEIKPKWLAQSPTAPPGATTCRNCAVSAKRWSEAPEGQKPKKSDPEKYGCPLHLVGVGDGSDGDGRGHVNGRENGNGKNGHNCHNGQNGAADGNVLPLPDDWKALAERIFRQPDPRHSHFLFASIRRHNLLPSLRAHQRRLATADGFVGASSESPDPDLLLAMTLRDCSLFFRYEVLECEGGNGRVQNGTNVSSSPSPLSLSSSSSSSPSPSPLRLRMLDFKLADLDKKSPQKIPGWQDTEEGLVEGGWYEGAKKGRDEMPHCLLKRVRPNGNIVSRDRLAPCNAKPLKDEATLGTVYEEY